MRLIKLLGLLVIWLAAGLCTLWAIGALYYDFPFASFRIAAAIAFLLLVITGLFLARSIWSRLGIVFGGFALVTCWWLTLKPDNNRAWQPDVDRVAWADINGDLVIFHNVRNYDYRSETDFTPRWETRTIRLSQLAGIDIAITYWGSPWMAHPIVSFRFKDALPLCFSIETRKAIGQQYSAIAGFYRQFTLIYVVADERDPVRLRTNYRQGEDVYLYHTLASPVEARARFLEYVGAVNDLRTHPRWYNAVTTNCTTSIRTQRPTKERLPWDWRILLNGKADELLYERHLIATGGLSFPDLKRRSLINQRARAADQDPKFSKAIREELPGS